MTETIIKLDQLEKCFDSHEVLRSISAEVRTGDVIGLLGLNGAGKTTLLETALGFAVPDSGSTSLFGRPASAIADERIKHRIGFVPQQDELIETMKGSEFLGLIGRFYSSWNSDLIGRLARDWDVPLGKPAMKLSVGQRQKLSILAALGHEPELIVLDEPVASLDPLARRIFLQELIGMVSSGERTIVFSTHIVSDLERIANRVWVLKDGRLVVDEALDNLKESGVKVAQAGGSRFPASSGVTAGMSLEEIFLELHK
ncbi:MAG TPA: ABC transporter ATP-binding protein [Gammaproteobacteria bacterium]|nr:ABC transporter ATP-binding protein [Gammaproteobacteria bacterium]